ncbi:MAG: protein kinase [Saprospiraceae bacterium]|nr:protein kinase [Saprospiraceae bacterium]
MNCLMECPDSFLPLSDTYEYLSTLGEGRFGVVFLVENRDTNTRYALKLLKLKNIPAAHQDNIKKRFELEFLTGKINSPFLVNTHELEYKDGIPYFTMDYCPNSNLERKIHGGMQGLDRYETAKNIIAGLHILHQHGKIHRDLKPENILFDADMRPRLSDFGICGHLNHSLTKATADNKPGQVFGSYAYMAPEQINPKSRQDTILPACDIFSLGVVLYEMFTGSLPFGKWQELSDIQPYLDRASAGVMDPIPDSISPVWKEVIKTCLQPDPEKRYHNMAEVMLAAGIADAHFDENKTDFKTACIIELQGENHNKIYRLTSGNLFLLGRENPIHHNDIAIRETLSRYISSRQATVERYEHRFFIRDGQWSAEAGTWYYPKNSTYVNGKKIEKNESRLLRDNDIIIAGNTTLRFITN